jgi:hypothetical protein
MEGIDVRSLTMAGRQMLRQMVVRLRKQSEAPRVSWRLFGLSADRQFGQLLKLPDGTPCCEAAGPHSRHLAGAQASLSELHRRDARPTEAIGGM